MPFGIGITISMEKSRGGPSSAAQPAAPPLNIDIPIIYGIARVGVALFCDGGSWDGIPVPTLAYQWKAAGANVGTNSPNYTPVVGDTAKVMTCQITATNTGGSANSTSLGTLPVLQATNTIAERLIGNEPNGIAVGFQDNSLIIRDAVTPANNYDASAVGKLTFTRATVAFTTNVAGLLVSTAINTMRFNYDPITHDALGLLIEASVTNLCLQSQTLEAASWTKENVTIGINATVAPDGTSTADKIISTSINDAHRIIQTNLGGASAGTTSAYVKAEEWEYVLLRNVATQEDISFNMLTGVITDPGGGATATCTMTDVGNSWWRITMTVTAPSVTNILLFISPDGNPFTPGDGVSGAYAWGIQFEQQATPSSYVVTTTASVARSGDLCSLPLTAFNFNASVGTMVSDTLGLINFNSQFKYAAAINAGTTDFYGHPITTNQLFRVASGNVTVASITVGTGTNGQQASAWAVNDFASSREGNTTLVDTAGALPVGVTVLTLGAIGATSFLNGNLAKFMHLPRRATNTELEQLSIPFV